jgi:hypothetical protein
MSEIEQMIDDCEKRESQLSDWEIKFIDSLGSQIAAGKGITAKQAIELESIWDAVTG